MMARWRRRLPRRGATASAVYRDWLRCPGSLTARLVAASNSFRVEVLFQGLARLDADEAALFALAPGALAWVREVCLICDGRPCIFARSVLPRLPRRGLDRWFHGMGTRSLGSVLFAGAGITRGVLEFSPFNRRARLFQRALQVLGEPCATLWARRSLFAQGDKQLLVAEVFLPAVLSLASR
jgi:chorismate--pyruvate lyase